jgi:hypothetical protein
MIRLCSPFVGPWPLFQFTNLIHSRLDSLDGGSARLRAATYTQTSMSPVGFEPTMSVLERAKTVHASDRAATVIGYSNIRKPKYSCHMDGLLVACSQGTLLSAEVVGSTGSGTYLN